MRILIKMMKVYKFSPKFFYNIPNSADIWYTKNEYVSLRGKIGRLEKWLVKQ